MQIHRFHLVNASPDAGSARWFGGSVNGTVKKKKNLTMDQSLSDTSFLQGDEKAQKKFQEVSEAYDTLKDPGKRNMYNRVGPEGMDSMGGDAGFGGAQGFGGFSGFPVRHTFS